MLIDAHIREEALNPHESFIVQAPAGSGKTTLLVNRFIRLLSVVEKPESIWAVTFTRKAAHEMRHRVIEALSREKNPAWESLINNPNQLQIMTIDSMCRSLNDRLPLLSKGGMVPQLESKPEPYYEEAVQRLLRELEGEACSVQEALKGICLSLDNRLEKLQTLFCELLAKRDQWLALTVSFGNMEGARPYLEKCLNGHVQKQIDSVKHLLPVDLKNALQKASQTENWCEIADLFLTKKGTFRQKIDKKRGFLHEHQALVESLQGVEGFEEGLAGLLNLPRTHYEDDEWDLLSHLWVLLPRLVAHLKLVFLEKNRVDFVEMSLNADSALSALNEGVSDLSLSMDYQLQHILIDEFQDTSALQFQLFEKLIAGWELHDGRTLFLVGDPMQSIYRFRGAEVGLFEQVQQNGMGGVFCKNLRLQVNFRSQSGIVSWVNELFSQKMKNFAPSVAKDTRVGEGVFYVELSDQNQEAFWVLERILQRREKAAELSIAILARAKNHFSKLIPLLEEAKVPFIAHELDTLENNAAVRDLLTLLRFGLNPLDKLAQLALFRSPFFGLSLKEASLLMQNFSPSNEGHPIVYRWLSQTQAESLAFWLKGFWLALGGPSLYSSSALRGVEQVFEHLLNETWLSIQIDTFEKNLLELLDSRNSEDPNPIQLMTVHKAKGLEFDEVFIMGANKEGAKDKKALIRFSEYPAEKGVNWMIAPLSRTQKQKAENPIYDYLGRVASQKNHDELIRLFYVAVTRAKKACYISQYPSQRKYHSFEKIAEHLTPELGHVKLSNFPFSVSTEIKERKQWPRKAKTWKMPDSVAQALRIEEPIVIDAENALWQKQGYLYNAKRALDEQNHLGIIVHRLLETIASMGGMNVWQKALGSRSIVEWRAYLSQEGVNDFACQEQFLTWLQNIHNDERLLWILSPHEKSQQEWVILEKKGQSAKRHVIDRSFVFANQRYIIDYKTGHFEEAHLEQLWRYQKLIETLQEPYPLVLALYYPFSREWKEVANAYGTIPPVF